MTANMTVEVKGLAELERKFGRVLEPLRPAFEKIALAGDRSAREGTKPHAADTGKLQRGDNVRHALAPPAQPLWAKVYTRSPIVITLDQGREPGGKMPPIKAMARWAERHGIPLKRDGKNIAFYLARAVVRKGTKGVRFFKSAEEEMERKAPGILSDAAREIERGFGK